jgi:DNA-binding NarL/FixJ family response regulator
MSHADGHHKERIRILVVDDYEPWRRSVCSMLRVQRNLQVIDEASDGLEAIQKAQTLKPDLLLLDIGLPQLNGLEVEKQLRHVVPGAKVLFLSQDNDADVVQEALSNGAQGYVLKADAGELLAAIKAVIDGERYVSSGIENGETLDRRGNRTISL